MFQEIAWNSNIQIFPNFINYTWLLFHEEILILKKNSYKS